MNERIQWAFETSENHTAVRHKLTEIVQRYLPNDISLLEHYSDEELSMLTSEIYGRLYAAGHNAATIIFEYGIAKSRMIGDEV